MKKFKALFMIMVMVMALTGSVPTVEAKTKTSITVTNKATGKKIGKKVTLKASEKIQLKVKYGKKNVTKKVKYKTSNKNIATVSKKGKITAKSAGTCTVKVTYKKKVKKIKVTVKAVEKKTGESTKSTETTTTKKTTNNSTEPIETEDYKISSHGVKVAKSIESYEKLLKQCALPEDPHPECNHQWDLYCRYYGDLSNDEDKMDKAILYEVRCQKCGDHGRPNLELSARAAFTYTDEELSRLITYYDDSNLVLNKHHTHKKCHDWVYLKWLYHPEWCDDCVCEYCSKDMTWAK